MKIISKLSLLKLTTLFISGCGFNKSDEYRTNVLLILADDMGFGDVGFNGNPWIVTPTLDSLSKCCFRFNNFYVSPVSAPTRASLLTGRYHYRTGTTWVTAGKENMNPAEYTLAELMHDNDYTTGCFGKWHNGAHYPFHPLQQGFDVFSGFCLGHKNNYFNTPVEENGHDTLAKGFLPDYFTQRALEFIQQNQHKPFFCFIPLNTPHSPFQVPDAYFDKYKSKGFDDITACVYGMCENIDDNLKILIDGLKSLGLTDNTLVIFMSDNGPVPGRYNAGLRGTKGHLHEGGVKVPFLMYVPERLIKNGKNIGQIEQIAAHIDIMPTLVDLLKLTPKQPIDFDGLSLVKVLNGTDDNKISHRMLFDKAPQRNPEKMGGAVRTGDYRLIYQENDTLLFNLKRDPSEETNLIYELPVLRDSLLNAYMGWIDKMFEELPAFTSVPIGVKGQMTIVLPANEANLEGNVCFREGSGWANDWAWNFLSENDSMYWDICVETSGEYEIGIEYCCSAIMQGSIVEINSRKDKCFHALDETFEGEFVPSPDRSKRNEAYEKTWGSLLLGRIALYNTDNYLSIKLKPLVIRTPSDFEIIAVRLNKIAE